MDGFGGFIFTFLIFIFAIKWAVVKRAGGNLVFRTSFDGGYGKYGRRRQRFFSDDDSFINSSTGFTRPGYFRDHAINPANGLPMIGGIGNVDVFGNPYGMDSSDHISKSSFSGSSFFGSGFGGSSSFSSSSSFSDGFNSGFGSGIDS